MASVSEPAADAALQSPYVGLTHYVEERADVFFGRDAERTLIIGNLRAARLTLLYAQSGVGKSSLLRAGVAARLRTLAQRSLAERGTAGYIPVVFSSWRDEPTDELVRELRESVDPFVPEPLPAFPGVSLHEAIQAAATAANATLLVILDQFEEYFLYSSREARAHRFADELAACIVRGDLRANFLIAVREDAYAGLGDLFRGQVGNLYGNYLHLEYLDRAAAREAIVRPIEHLNASHDMLEPVTIEPALVDAVLDQVRAGCVAFDNEGRGVIAPGTDAGENPDQIETPYLQLVMAALWDHERSAGSQSLRLSTLVELGGAQRIVHSHLDNAMSGLGDEERDTAAEVFNHLVTPSGTKIAHTIPDLAGYSGREPAQVQALIDRLTGGGHRILRPVPAAPGDEERPRVEIFHDVLAPAILAWRSTRTATRLEREKRDAEARASRERRRARTFRAMAVVSLVLLLAALVAFVLARVEANRAVRAQHAALSRELAADSAAALQTGALDRAALLSLDAYRYGEDPLSRSGLVGAVQATADMAEYLSGHPADITGVAYSPDGKLIASSGSDGRVFVQDAVTGRAVHVLAHPGHTSTAVAFSPDGKLVATASDDGTIGLWNATTGQPTATLRGPSTGVFGVAFNPDGRTLASADGDGTVAVWDLRAERALRVLRLGAGRVDAVAFNPGGTVLAAGGQDQRVALWSSATGRRLRELSPGDGEINSVAFAPGGATLAAGGDGGQVTLWNAHTGRRTDALRGHTSAVNAVAYSPRGTMLASAGDDRTVILWDARTGRRVAVLHGHSAGVESVAFSPSGRTLASGGADRHVIVWYATPRLLTRTFTLGSPVPAVAFSPDGSRLAAGDASGRVVEWSGRTGAPVRVLTGDHGPVLHVAFSPDGRALATANADGTVSLWNAATGQSERTFRADSTRVYGLAFSRDGRTLASGGYDGTVVLWDPATGRRQRTLRGHSDIVYSVAFSPDGHTLASGSADQSIILWDVASGRRVRTLTGHTAEVESVAFSPDGRTLASGSDDRTIILWDVSTGRALGEPLTGATRSVLGVAFSPSGRLLAAGDGAGATMLWDVTSRLALILPRHAKSVEGVAFSPNGRALATAGLDGTVQLSGSLPAVVAFGTVQARLCGVVRRSLTRAEWDEFVPNQAYRRTCPG